MFDTVRAATSKLQDEIDQGHSLSEIRSGCDLLRRIRDLKDEANAVYKKLYAMNEKMARELVPRLFEAENVTSINFDGYRYTTSVSPRASLGEDKEACHKWLRENELGDIVIETVNAQTLTSAQKHMLEEGEEGLDEDLFKLYMLENTSVTKL